MDWIEAAYREHLRARPRRWLKIDGRRGVFKAGWDAAQKRARLLVERLWLDDRTTWEQARAALERLGSEEEEVNP